MWVNIMSLSSHVEMRDNWYLLTRYLSKSRPKNSFHEAAVGEKTSYYHIMHIFGKDA